MKFAAVAGEERSITAAGRPARRNVATMSLLHRARAALSLHVAAARVGVRPSTLRMWTEVGAGPAPDERGGYRRDVVTAWMAEISHAVDSRSAGTRGD